MYVSFSVVTTAIAEALARAAESEPALSNFGTATRLLSKSPSIQ